MSDESQTPDGGDRRGERRHERDERRRQRAEHGWGGPWIGGVILIVLGVIFLLKNFGWEMPKNWWAAFILIPAIGSLMAAQRTYEANGHQWTAGVVAPGIAGVIFVVMAVALYLGIDWGAFWPVILILVGLGVMARSYWRR